jgi:hypothetical protein
MLDNDGKLRVRNFKQEISDVAADAISCGRGYLSCLSHRPHSEYGVRID